LQHLFVYFARRSESVRDAARVVQPLYKKLHFARRHLHSEREQ